MQKKWHRFPLERTKTKSFFRWVVTERRPKLQLDFLGPDTYRIRNPQPDQVREEGKGLSKIYKSRILAPHRDIKKLCGHWKICKIKLHCVKIIKNQKLFILQIKWKLNQKNIVWLSKTKFVCVGGGVIFENIETADDPCRCMIRFAMLMLSLKKTFYLLFCWSIIIHNILKLSEPSEAFVLFKIRNESSDFRNNCKNLRCLIPLCFL